MSRPTAPEPPRAQSTLPRPTSGNDDAAMERFFSLLGRIPPESLEEELEEDQARNMLKSVGFSDKRIEHAIRYCRLTSDDHFGSVTLPDLLRRIGQPRLAHIAAGSFARTQTETELEYKKRSIAERYRLRSDWSKSDSDLSERSLDMSGPGAPAEPVDDCQRKASGMPLHSMTNSIPQRRMHLGGGTPKPGKIVEVTTFADEHHGGRTSRGRKHVQQAWAEPLVDQNKLVQDIILKGFSERAARIVADYQSKPKPQANAPRGLDPDNPLPTSVRRRFMVSENDDFCYTGQAGTKADMPLRASTRGTPLAGGSWKVATTSPTSADASGSECCKEPKPPPTPKPGKLFKAIGAALGSFSKASAGMGTGSRTGSRRT